MFCTWVLYSFAVFALAIVGGMRFLGRLFFRVKSKGYKPPFACLIVILSLIAGVLAGGIAFYTISIGQRTESFTVVMLWFFLAFYLFFGIGIGVSSLVMALVTAALPQRKARVFGARKVRFPFAIVGWFEIVGGTLLLLYLFSDFPLNKLLNHWNILAGTYLLAILPGLYFLELAKRRKKTLSLTQVIAEDKRPPVFYLRSFKEESLPFVAEYTDTGGDEPYANTITLEKYLSAKITELIGPFVALGSPEDYLPPEGAARFYAEDKNCDGPL